MATLQYSCLENPMDRGFWRAIAPAAAKSDTTEVTEQSSSSNALSYQKSRRCCSHADRTCCLASLHSACSQGVSSCHPGGEKPLLPVCRAHVLCPFSLSVSYRIRNTCHRTLLEEVREMESSGVQVLRRDSVQR